MTNCPIFIQPPEFVSASEITGSFSAPWRSSPHMHRDTEIFFIQDGQGEFLIDNKIFQAAKGDLIVYNPFCEHEEISSKTNPLKGLSAIFRKVHLLGKDSGFITDPEHTPIINLQDSYNIVNTLFLQIYTEYSTRSYGYMELNSSLLYSIIIILYRKMDFIESKSISQATYKVKKYIEENFNKDLSLNDLSDLVYISPYHLAHTFKDEMGVSPIQYLINCRIEEAKKLLLNSNQSISDIAAHVGYSNANYFNILFKKATGKSPGKFR